MDRENYYLLLGLSVDPPEKDPKVIQEAVKRKQAEWSKFRNHPTKSMQAKQLIGLIPDIRKVFSDPKLRQKEAVEAKKRLQKSEAEKFEKVDRHIALLMSKGSITKKEISALAEMDGVEERLVQERVRKNEMFLKIDAEVRALMREGDVTKKAVSRLAKKFAIEPEKVREWVEKKQGEIFEEIDRYIEKCCDKGFITEEAIDRMVKIYGIKESRILERLKCPISKDYIPKSQKSKPLDASLIKLINDNLKIVGRSSLYDFLDMPENAPLDILQEVSREKEMEVRRIGQKNAVTTASAALAGHCIVIFRSVKSRKAYDMTRSLTRLSELTTDIQVAAIEGQIRAEYFEFLVRKATRIGMDFEEAVDYIQEYCEKENLPIEERIEWFTVKRGRILIREKWTIELSPKKPGFWILAGAAAAVLAVVVIGAIFSLQVVQAGRVKSAYKELTATLRNQPSLEVRERSLEAFVDRYGRSEYAAEARSKLSAVRREIETADYEAAVAEAEKLEASGKLEAAGEVYARFLDEHPRGAHAGEIQKRVDRIPELVDDRDFRRLKRIADGEYSEKIRAYNRYFAEHPDGKHIAEVRALVMKMVDQYFAAAKRELDQCERGGDYRECIRIAEAFMQKFAGTEQARTMEGLKIKYEKRLQHNQDIQRLKELAAVNTAQADFEGAKLVYEDYLQTNPESPSYMRERIADALNKIEAQKQKYLGEEREWEEVLSYSKDRLRSLGERIGRLERYLSTDTSGRHTEEANALLAELRQEKAEEDQRSAAEREQREWSRILALAQNPSVSLEERIARVAAFIGQGPSQQYRRGAESLLRQLRQEKQAQDERLRAQQARQARIRNEQQRIRQQAARSGGRYIPSSDGAVVTDRRTGLMWAAVDSYMDLGRCLDFNAAQQYVSNLNVGGHGDWRLPTLSELAGIYKTQPFFPASQATWYWSSDLIWHGWNKKAYIVTAKQETAWNRIQSDLNKCGAVRPVRGR